MTIDGLPSENSIVTHSAMNLAPLSFFRSASGSCWTSCAYIGSINLSLAARVSDLAVFAFGAMAVLHITNKYNRETSNADHDGFYKVITSYGWARLSESNWTIKTNEPPQAVWQKLSHCIDPNDYLVMLPLDVRSFTPQDGKALKWILSRP